MYRSFLKRLIDILISICIFILSSPVLCIATILLTIVNKGKPFFLQSRPGKGEKIFKIIKLKTMTDEKGSDGQFLPDSQRLTVVGGIIRKTSIDEIPQLINVIKGDMSLIGPRPLLIEYLPYYTEVEKLRHTVRPGISGWAQVNGRNHLSWNERLELDVYYVRNISMWLDFRIIPLTIKNVISQKNVNEAPGLNIGRLDVIRKNKM